MFLKRLAKNQKGDTIIEVLLAIAVVSMVLGGAYVIANKSLIASREAQERGIALKLTESQLEKLKSLAASGPDQVFGALTTFCIKNDGTVAATTDSGCRVDSEGNASTTEPTFALSIVRNDVTDVFTAETKWAKYNTGGNNTVKITYRVHQ